MIRYSKVFSFLKEATVRRPGVERGTSAWKAPMLTVTPSTPHSSVVNLTFNSRVKADIWKVSDFQRLMVTREVDSFPNKVSVCVNDVVILAVLLHQFKSYFLYLVIYVCKCCIDKILLTKSINLGSEVICTLENLLGNRKWTSGQL